MLFLFFLAVGFGISSAVPVENVETLPGRGYRCIIDLGLVVDTTKSIREENIAYVKESLKSLVPQFGVGPSGTHMSFETFAKKPKIHNLFSDEEYWSEESMLELIDSSINKLGQPTRLDLALKKADYPMFSEEFGTRPGIPGTLLLWTDGRSNPAKTEDFMPFIKSLKSKAVRIVVVAVGPGAKKKEYREVLETIGGENVIYVADYPNLPEANKNISDLICPPSPCDMPLDLALVLDKTQSLGVVNFEMLKGFAQQLTYSVGIDADGTHTGLILFAKSGDVKYTFADSEYYTTKAVDEYITNLPDELGGKTYIDRALIAANESLFTVVGGDRPDVRNVLILMTDGKTNPNSVPFGPIVDALEGKDVHRIAVGIGNYKKFIDQLYEIAGEENTFTADDFDELSDLLDDILENACQPGASVDV